MQEDTRPGLRATAPLQSRMLEKLSDVQRGAVLAAGAALTLARREVLEHQGDPARTFYLVEAGYLKLTQLTATGDEVVVRFVGPGEPYGGVVVLEHDTYPVSAHAVEQVTVMGWPRDILRRLTDDIPQLRMNIVTEIAQHMRDALTRVQQLQTTRVGQRLAATLLHLARPLDGTLQIAHPITRQELAEMTGATLFTVSRTLSDWESRGWIATVQTRIRLLKPAHIERTSSTSDPVAGCRTLVGSTRWLRQILQKRRTLPSAIRKTVTWTSGLMATRTPLWVHCMPSSRRGRHAPPRPL